MPIEYSSYSLAKTNYDSAVDHLNKIHPSSAKTLEARIESNRQSISELNKDKDTISLNCKVINEYSQNNLIFSLWHSVFPPTTPETTLLSNSLEKAIAKDEDQLADQIIQGIYSENPNYEELSQKIDLLIGNRDKFYPEKAKISTLIQKVKKGDSLIDFEPNDKILENLDKKNTLENKIAFTAFKIQEKLLEKAKLKQEQVQEPIKEPIQKPIKDPIQKSIRKSKENEFTAIIKSTAASRKEGLATPLMNQLIVDLSRYESRSFRDRDRDVKEKLVELNGLLKEKNGQNLPDLEKLIACKEIIADRASGLDREIIQHALGAIDKQLEELIKSDLKEIDLQLPRVEPQRRENYIKKPEAESSPIIHFIFSKLKTLKNVIGREFTLQKKKGVPLPEELKSSPENQARFGRERKTNAHFDQLARFHEEINYKTNTLKPGPAPEFQNAEKIDLKKEQEFQKNIYPDSPITITPKMEENIKKFIDYRTWALLTDLQKFSLLSIAKEPNDTLAAEKINEALKKYQEERIK